MPSVLDFPGPISTPLQYPTLTYDEFVAALITYFKARAKRASDFTEASLGVVLLEAIAFAGAQVSMNLLSISQEVYIDTIRDRRNMALATSLIGYRLGGATPASVNLEIDYTASLAQPSLIVIAAGTKIVSANGVIFEVAENMTIKATSNPPHTNWEVNGVQTANGVSVPVIQGETSTASFVANGRPFQTYTLAKTPVIDGTIVVTVDGVPWKLVDSLVIGDVDDATNTDVFITRIDHKGVGSVAFGDGVNGGIPLEGQTVVVTYRTGGGVAGNVPPNALTGSIAATIDGLPGAILVTNEVSASGGSEAETLEHARFFAPKVTAANNRAVTYQDYFALSAGFHIDGIGTVAKVGIIADPTDATANVVSVYVWAEDDAGNLVAPVGASLKAGLKKFLDARRLVTVATEVYDGGTVAVDLRIRAKIKPGFVVQTAIDGIKAAVQDLFRASEVKYGNHLRGSRIWDVVQDVAGVDWCEVTVDPTSTATSPFRPSEVVTLAENARVIHEETVTLSQAEAALFGTRSVRVPLTGLWTNGLAVVIPDLLQTFQVVDVSTTALSGYDAPPIGSAKNPWRRIIEQFSYDKNATLSPAHNLVIVDRDIDRAAVFIVGTSPTKNFRARVAHARAIKLASGRITSVGQFRYHMLRIVDGTGAGQERAIIDAWPSASCPVQMFNECAIVDSDWDVFPDGTSRYVILPNLLVPQDKALIAGTINVEIVSG